MNDFFVNENEIETKLEKTISNFQTHIHHMYIDITGDFIAGALLSQILYWFTEDKYGKSKLRIFKDGYYWIAKRRDEWYNEIRITKHQYDVAIKFLEKNDYVILEKYKFNSLPTVHIRPNYEKINTEIQKWKDIARKGIVNGNVNQVLRNEYEYRMSHTRKTEKKNSKSKKENHLGDAKNHNSIGNNEIPYSRNQEFHETGINNLPTPLTETTNKDYYTKTTDSNKVFSNEKTIYNNKVSPTRETYRSPDIPYDYTEEEFKDFITKKTDHILHGISPEEKDASVKPISAIISYFYKRYYECIGERHPILTDMVYAKIIMKLLDPSDEVYRRGFRLDEMAYSAMIDKFFQTDYGVKSGNFTDYRMPYFMQDTVQNNLVYSAGVV